MRVRKALPEEYASVNALFSIAFEAAPSAGPAIVSRYRMLPSLKPTAR